MPDFLFFQFYHNINICQRETLDLFDMLIEQSALFLAPEKKLAVPTEQVTLSGEQSDAGDTHADMQERETLSG